MTATEISSVSKIMEIFESNDTDAKVKFLRECPDSPVKETAEKYISQPYPEVNLCALNLLAETYSRGIDCNLGVVLSEAIYKLAKQALAMNPEKDVYDAYLFCTGNSLNSWLLSLNSLGQYQNSVRVAEKGLQWLKDKPYKESQEHQCMLRLSLVEAYFGLAHGNDDRKKKFLAKVETILNTTEWDSLKGAYKFKLTQLRQQYNRLVQDATNLPISPETKTQQEQKQFNREISQNLNILKESLKNISDFLSVYDLNNILNEAQKIQLQKKIRNACLIFADSVKGRDQKLIKNSLTALKEARRLARQNNFIEDENDALWGLYLCYSRSQQEDSAIKALQSLRRNLESLRNQISDPMKGAGVFTKFPYLFASLCQLLCRAARSEELLDAMEGAKGRVLADVLTESRGEIIEDSTFTEPVKYLPELMQQVYAHYLSYFVDDESTYAVLVAKDGSLHSHEIALGKEKLRKWSLGIDPQKWGTYPKGLNGPKIPKVLSDKLSPLVDWLEPFTKLGLLKREDHICYCPDEELHLVPLHYVTFLNEPLVKYVSLSRIHGASALVSILRRPLEYFSQAVAIQVPYEGEKKQSKEGETYHSKLQQFDREPDWLMKNLLTNILKEEAADLQALKNLNLCNKIIHFSTHGRFPENENPYTNSGLMLAFEGKLPNLENAEAKILDDIYKKHLLSPKKILVRDKDTIQNLNFSESHISLMACVSGLSKEGIGGDALGLEWAFLLAGADSLLSTHWDVDAMAATEFILRFYDKWLNQRFPRYAAWRETVLELMNYQWSSAEHCSTYYWAAFSLSGDWR